MHQALADAAALEVTVFAASGDGLATDDERDGKLHVDYPASDPLVVGCGGTRITVAAGAISDEAVWKSSGGGTGGGVSSLFARQGYQAHATVPKAPTPKGGRGVPDVAGDADPDSGYRVVTDSRISVVGGTSAVSSLWAGIVASLNAGQSTPLGDLNAALYAAPGAFRDVTRGDSRAGQVGYAAAPGWDPCTGLIARSATRCGNWSRAAPHCRYPAVRRRAARNGADAASRQTRLPRAIIGRQPERRATMKLIVLLATAGLLAAPGYAAACRDAKGKFIKCPAAAPAAATRCKDAKGKFVKCGTPGAKPVG